MNGDGMKGVPPLVGEIGKAGGAGDANGEERVEDDEG